MGGASNVEATTFPKSSVHFFSIHLPPADHPIDS
eukprot:COSAG02_NODE_53447_length_301_cov_9.004950_1_plen_33_part_01